MFSRLVGLKLQRMFLQPSILLGHTKTCPTRILYDPCAKKSDKVSSSSDSGDGGLRIPDFKRALRSGAVRFGFIPEEWFVFFHPYTGVSGPYVFGVAIINYWLSKEIYVMEHEYYLGLSIALVTYYATTTFGPEIAKSFDEEVDAIEKDWEKGRQDERNYCQNIIKKAQEAQARANGQKLLMDAKKENIAMQLEAAYRERLMHVYNVTKGRLIYQAKTHMALNKIHQKWMLEWILENVRKSITPEFEEKALKAAIRDLSAVADRM